MALVFLVSQRNGLAIEWAHFRRIPNLPHFFIAKRYSTQQNPSSLDKNPKMTITDGSLIEKSELNLIIESGKRC